MHRSRPLYIKAMSFFYGFNFLIFAAILINFVFLVIFVPNYLDLFDLADYVLVVMALLTVIGSLVMLWYFVGDRERSRLGGIFASSVFLIALLVILALNNFDVNEVILLLRYESILHVICLLMFFIPHTREYYINPPPLSSIPHERTDRVPPKR